MAEYLNNMYSGIALYFISKIKRPYLEGIVDYKCRVLLSFVFLVN